MIKKFVLLASFILGFLLVSCENNVTDPGKSGPSISFRLDNSGHSNPGIGLLNRGLKSRQFNPSQILKASGFDELRLMCLDMTRFTVIDSFFSYWYNTNQRGLIDYTLWDSTKDAWDNWVLLLKRYPGDAYDFIGDYSFSISDSIAKGTVYLNPGLNYFIYALRSGGKTGGYLGETYATISKDSANVINLEYTNSAPDYPSSPHPPDYQTGVFLTAQLKWVCTDPDFDPITYDVYLGTNYSPPLVASNITTAAYTPAQLLPNTTYYWYVVAKDDHGNVTNGFTWQFNTGT